MNDNLILAKFIFYRLNLFSLFNVFMILILVGCSNQNIKRVYVVKKGDTVYSITRKHRVELQNFVKLNKIDSRYTLKPGQKLLISKVAGNKIKDPNNISKLSNDRNQHKALRAAESSKIAIAKMVGASSANNVNKSNTAKKFPTISWSWPASGKIIKSFTIDPKLKFNGIDIAGRQGDQIFSASNGKVVYVGNSLRGYGNLIIIKHDEDFLSAYAHNYKILVKEQQIVKQGQQIATMGNTDAKTVKLHFQVRFKGQPVDPLKFLPKFRY